MEYLEYFFVYLSFSSNQPFAYFKLCLGDRIEIPKELRALLKEQDKYYNWSSFLESYDKIEDIDINPFGGHDKTDSHPDETGENIPLKPGGASRGSTREPEFEQETSFGGGKLNKEGSPILMWIVCTALLQRQGRATNQ